MVNEERGSFWEQQVLAMCIAVVVAIVAMVVVGNQHVAWAYFSGALYGMLSYELWLLLFNNCGSMIYEEGEEPKCMSVKQGCVALLLPPVVVIVIAIAGIFLTIAWLSYLYDLAMRHYRIKV